MYNKIGTGFTFANYVLIRIGLKLHKREYYIEIIPSYKKYIRNHNIIVEYVIEFSATENH